MNRLFGKTEKRNGKEHVSANGKAASASACESHEAGSNGSPSGPLVATEGGAAGEGNYSACTPENGEFAEQFAREVRVEEEGFSACTPNNGEIAEQFGAQATEAEPAKGKRGRPRALSDYDRGKMVMGLAIGVSQTQVAAWLGCDQKTVANELRADPRLVDDLAWHKSVVRLVPFLRIYNEAASNWKASVWLLEYLDKRRGVLTMDDLMTMLMEMWGKSRHAAPPEAWLSPASCTRPEEAA